MILAKIISVIFALSLILNPIVDTIEEQTTTEPLKLTEINIPNTQETIPNQNVEVISIERKNSKNSDKTTQTNTNSNTQTDENSFISALNQEKIDKNLLNKINSKTKATTENIQRVLVLTNNQISEGSLKMKLHKNSLYLGTINNVVGIDLDLTDLEALIDLSNHPNVNMIIENPVLHIATQDSTVIINSNDLNQLNVSDTFINGSGNSVCLLDTGVDYTHPDLQNHIILGPDYVNGDGDPMDDHGHGTHLAGIVHAVAPEANIVAIKVCDGSKNCGGWEMIQGINWCSGNKATYTISSVSMSISDGSVYNNSTCPTWMDTELNNAYSNNLFIVASSGNEGSSLGVSYPACSPYTISVGATTKLDAISTITNKGPNLDLLAPGSAINSTKLGGGYELRSGTSTATPHVVAAALLLKQFRSLHGFSTDINTLKDILKSTGVIIDSWPRIDILAATADYGTCNLNSDCGTDGFIGNDYCSLNNVWDTYRTYTCNNPGTATSSCSYTENNQTKEVCTAGCNLGACLPDSDSDGYEDSIDCAPNNASIHPNATEICNLVDDNCNNQTDENSCPDLSISSCELVSQNPATNDWVMFKVVLNNTGFSTAENIYWKMDTDSPEQNQIFGPFSLNVGEHVNIYPEYKYNSTGTYNPTFIVDFDGLIIEENELNNQASIPVTII